MFPYLHVLPAWLLANGIWSILWSRELAGTQRPPEHVTRLAWLVVEEVEKSGQIRRQNQFGVYHYKIHADCPEQNAAWAAFRLLTYIPPPRLP